MKNNLFKKMSASCFAIFIIVCYAEAQTLPAQFHFSDNGRILTQGNITPSGFYDRETIDTIFITFAESNYWNLLTSNYDSSTDLLATLNYKGTTYDSVGVRFKGLTSYMMVQGQKKSFNITLDTVKTDQNIEGYTTFNLNNSAEDASFMREFMYNYFQSLNVPCARTNYKVLMLNNECWGLYVNVQQLDKQHVREWFTDADATRWRALSPTWSMNTTGGGPGGGGGFGGDPGGGAPGGGAPGGMGDGFGAGKSTLNYLGSDTALYTPNYTLKKAYKDDPWFDLAEACRVLNTVSKENLIDSLSEIFDIDGALWFLAHEIIFTDDDSYINKGGMDYYVYYDVGTHRIIPIEFDGNSSFETKNVKSWDPFYKEDSVRFPLSNVLLNVPELRQRYLAHVRTILEQSFNKNYCDSVIDYYAAKIDSSVNNDTKKIFSYTEFKNETSALKTFMSERKSFYLSNNEVSKKGASISSVIYKAGLEDFSIPDSSQQVNVTCQVVADSGVARVYLYYDKGFAGDFDKVEMFDDGEHNDALASDNIFGGTIPAHSRGKYVRFYIEAIVSDAATTSSYSPAGAEHDVYVYRVKIAESEASPVVINEIMASNSVTAADPQGDYDDWIELYNTSPDEVNLSGHYLANGDKNLTKWQFPSGTTIDGNGYLIIWCDNDTLDTGLHTNFKLSAKGEEVLLLSPDTAILNNVTYNGQTAELSFSRMPNGTGSFTWQNATFNKENLVLQNSTKVPVSAAKTNIKIFPNPASNSVTIETNNTKHQRLTVYNYLGVTVFDKIVSETFNIDVVNWKSGLYLIKLDNSSISKLIVTH